MTNISKMGTRAVVKGPSSDRVAANVRELRTERRMTLDELAGRLKELGRPILKSGLSKLETGERRVDVDDLMALAMALEVTPNRLLLGGEADAAPIQLTEDYGTNRAQAWAWSCGEWVEGSRFPFTRFTGDRLPAYRFQSENRPHDPPRRLSAEEWNRLRGWQQRLDEILLDMSDADLPPWMFDELVKSGLHNLESASNTTTDGDDDGQR